MREFIILIGEILLIALLQTIFEVFLDKDKQALQIRMVNIACFLGSFYLLLQFVFTHILSEITTFVKLPF